MLALICPRHCPTPGRFRSARPVASVPDGACSIGARSSCSSCSRCSADAPPLRISATAGTKPRPSTAAAVGEGDVADLLERAGRAAPAEAARLQLEAAVLLALRDDLAAVAGLVDDLDGARLDTAGRGRLALLRAGVALDNGATERALNLIELAPDLQWHLADVDQQILFSRIRIRALEAVIVPSRQRAERVLLDGLLDPEARTANRARIWDLLASLSADSLEHALAGARGSPELAGWIELARIARGLYPTLEAQQADVVAWRQSRPDHSAAAAMPDRLARLPGLLARRPRHLALLLPLSGPLASAGTAVRDGFMAAHLEALSRGGVTPRITLIDSHAVESAAPTTRHSIRVRR
ncbi:MAG: penicillin-binding protein activator [Gammaproteobacteria bacterium]|nr:penicillin-binding protein activator [Gammaproteobacteria bacterium]